jgi:hypothetical protein
VTTEPQPDGQAKKRRGILARRRKARVETQEPVTGDLALTHPALPEESHVLHGEVLKPPLPGRKDYVPPVDGKDLALRLVALGLEKKNPLIQILLAIAVAATVIFGGVALLVHVRLGTSWWVTVLCATAAGGTSVGVPFGIRAWVRARKADGQGTGGDGESSADDQSSS